MKSNPKNKKSKLIEWRDALVFAVVVATLFRWSLAEAFVIPTGSMENSLLVGDYILVSKIHYGSGTNSFSSITNK
jgi:signal peptidase I